MIIHDDLNRLEERLDTLLQKIKYLDGENHRLKQAEVQLKQKYSALKQQHEIGILKLKQLIHQLKTIEGNI